MICPTCGFTNEDGARFCGNCGTNLSSVSSTPAEESSTEQASLVAQESSAVEGSPSAEDTSVIQESPAAQDVSDGQETSAAQEPASPTEPLIPQETPDEGDTQQPTEVQSFAQPLYQQTFDEPSPQPTQQQPAQSQAAQDPSVRPPEPQVAQGAASQTDQHIGDQSGVTQPSMPPSTTAAVPKKKSKTPIIIAAVAVVAAIIVIVLGVPFINRLIHAQSNPDQKIQLGEIHTDNTFGYSYALIGGYKELGSDQEGSHRYGWDDPFLVVNIYGESTNGDFTIDDAKDAMIDTYQAKIIESGDDYLVGKSTDEDGDVNYTKVYVTSNSIQYMDIFFHPEDEDELDETARAILESFTAGDAFADSSDEFDFTDDRDDDFQDGVVDDIDDEGDDGGNGDNGDVSQSTPVASGTTLTNDKYGFSIKVPVDGFVQYEEQEGSISLFHLDDPQMYLYCTGMTNSGLSLQDMYESMTSITSDVVTYSDPVYNEKEHYFTYTEQAGTYTALGKVYVTDDTIVAFSCMYGDGSSADKESPAADIAQKLADSFTLNTNAG
jgi:uncharacterized Zn finger protein (UPF0148 family)